LEALYTYIDHDHNKKISSTFFPVNAGKFLFFIVYK